MRHTFILFTAAMCAGAAEHRIHIPLAFERNTGQAPSGADAVAHAPDYVLTISGTEASILSAGAQPMRIRLNGANARATVELLDPLPGVSHYFRGNDPALWQRNVKQYRKARIRGVYPGVSMTFYGRDDRLEYDFEVEPGANPNAIEMEFDSEVTLDANGDIVVPSSRGKARLHAPLVYQGAKAIRGEHRLSGGNRVRFTLGEYDKAKPLVIDPVLTWSTNLAGGRPTFNDIVTDREGNMYLTGCAASGLPLVNAYLEEFTTDRDAILVKINPAGDTLLYSTYIGSGCASYLGLDRQGNVILTGTTTNRFFPLRNPANTRLGGSFLTKLSADGSELVYSTYLGGDLTDAVNNLALDYDGNAYVVGRTRAANFRATRTLGPISSPDATQAQVRTGFLAKFNGEGSWAWTARLGPGINPSSIALDAARAPVIGGSLCGERYPVNLEGTSAMPAGCDAFVARIDAEGSAMTSYLAFGGANWDGVSQLAVDPADNVFVAGVTFSSDMPMASGSLKGKWDTYVAKIVDGALASAAYLGGSGEETPSAISVDSAGRLTVAGTTTSPDFPLIDAVRVQRMGAREPLHVSNDGGRTWTGVLSGGEQNNNWYTWRGTVTALAATSNASIVYSADRFGVYRSNDGGLTWRLTFARPEGWQIRSIHPFPNNPESLYLVSSPAAPQPGVATPANTVYTIWLSTNGGTSFASRSTLSLPAADRFQFWFSNVDTNVAYALHRRRTDPQLFRSEDGARTWRRTGVLPDLFLSLTLDPTTKDRLYEGTDLGIQVSEDGGATWKMHSPCPRERYLACGYQEIYVDPANPKNIFFTRRGGREYGAVNQHTEVHHSIDGGITWTASPTPVNADASSFAADTRNPGTFYLGFTGANGLYRTTDNGKTWVPASHTAPFWTDTVNAVAVAGNRVLVGTNSGNDGFFATLSEDGATWIQSSYLGGTGNDSIGGLRADDNGWLVVINNIIQRIDNGNGGCEVTLQPAEINAHFKGASSRVTVRTGSECGWRIDNPAPWIAVTTPTSGKGTASFEMILGANAATATRTAELSINGAPLTVNQLASPTCTVTPDVFRLVAPTKHRDAVAVNYSGGCQWSFSKDAAWVTLDQPIHSGTTSFIPYTVEPNTGTSARMAQVNFATSGGTSTGTHSILQSATNCKTNVWASTEEVPATGGQVTLTVQSDPPNCAAWVADSGVNWMTPMNFPATTIGGTAQPGPPNWGVTDGSVTFTVQANTSPLERAARPQIAGVGIRIVQAGTTCTYAMKPASTTIDAATMQALVTVAAPAGCQWRPVSDSPWLRITSTVPTRGTAPYPATGPTGNGRVYFTVDANNTGAPRTATITAGEQTFTLTQIP